MMLSQKAYAAKKGVAASSIKGWYDKGFLPGASRNDCTGVYEIPADTPVPYHEKGLNKITKISTLMVKLLEAAEAAQSVFSSMFPGIEEDVFYRTLEGLVNGNSIEIIKTEYGEYIQITAEGAELKNKLTSSTSKIRENLNTVLVALGVFVPSVVQILTYIASNPEWAQNLMKVFMPK